MKKSIFYILSIVALMMQPVNAFSQIDFDDEDDDDDYFYYNHFYSLWGDFETEDYGEFYLQTPGDEKPNKICGTENVGVDGSHGLQINVAADKEGQAKTKVIAVLRKRIYDDKVVMVSLAGRSSVEGVSISIEGYSTPYWKTVAPWDSHATLGTEWTSIGDTLLLTDEMLPLSLPVNAIAISFSSAQDATVVLDNIKLIVCEPLDCGCRFFDFVDGYLCYSADYDGNAVLSTCLHEGGVYAGDIVIPPVAYDGRSYYNVMGIYEDAFGNCDSITSLTIPASMVDMSDVCGVGCLTVTNYARKPQAIRSNGLPCCKTLHVLPGCREAYANATGWKDIENIVEDAVEPVYYKPVLQEWRTWLVEHVDVNFFEETRDTTTFLISTNVFDGKSPVVRDVYRLDPTGKFFIQKYGRFCERDGKMSLLNDDFASGIMWDSHFMDFTLQEGDEGVESVDSIEVDGFIRKRIRYRGFVMVEGIGVNHNPFLPAFDNGTDQYERILAVYDADKCIFRASDFYKEAYNAPATGIITERMDTPRRPEAMYDLQGRRMCGRPNKGLYVRGGRKVLVK